MDEQRIIARDQNKVFVEKADRRALSPADAIQIYGLGLGKGMACIEFDIEPDLLRWQKNVELKLDEWFIVGDVSLANRNPQSYVNF
jgi:hypothetical protein